MALVTKNDVDGAALRMSAGKGPGAGWPAGVMGAQLHEALADLAALAASGVSDCAGAGVTLLMGGELSTAAATSEQARRSDQAQYEHGDGPCLTALRTAQPVSCEDYRSEQRWPEVAREALAVGVGSSLSLPLDDGTAVIGALNLYGTAPHGFDARSRANAHAAARQGSAGLRYLARLGRSGAALSAVEEASRVPQLSLPRVPVVAGLTCAVRYLVGGRSGRTGGDWCDLFELPDGGIAVAIGDAMGHGPTAAPAMWQLRAVLRSCAYEGVSPSTVLDRMDALVQDFDMAQTATVLHGRLMTGAHGARLRYANAGHLPPLLIGPDGTARYLDRTGSSLIGAPTTARQPRPEAAAELPAGSTLLLYTDGLVENRHRDIDVGLHQLQRAVTGHARKDGPEALCDRVLQQMAAHEQDDDVTVLAVHINGGATAPPNTPSAPDSSTPAAPPELAPKLALRLTHRLAEAENDSDALHRLLSGDGAADEHLAALAWRCLSLVQDALLFGAVEVAASLGIPDQDLPR